VLRRCLPKLFGFALIGAHKRCGDTYREDYSRLRFHLYSIYAFPIHPSINVLYKINNLKQIHADIMALKKAKRSMSRNKKKKKKDNDMADER
jgi:hypothetical protein